MGMTRVSSTRGRGGRTWRRPRDGEGIRREGPPLRAVAGAEGVKGKRGNNNPWGGGLSRMLETRVGTSMNRVA